MVRVYTERAIRIHSTEGHTMAIERYPSWRFHHSKPAVIVRDPAHEAEVAPAKDGWRESPADTQAPGDSPATVDAAPVSNADATAASEQAARDEAKEILAGPAPDVIAMIGQIEVDSALRVLEEVENSWKKRKTVLEALSARLKVLESPADTAGA